MERWDLYTQDRIRTGETMIRGEEIPEDRCHLVVRVWIVNAKGEYLISRRAASRPTFPLLWEAVGGSVVAGEDSLSGALREAKEEVGIDLAPMEGKLAGSEVHMAAGGKKYGSIRDVWLFPYDGAVSLKHATTDEVSCIKWMTASEIEKLHQAGELVPSSWESFGLIRDQSIERRKNDEYIIRRREPGRGPEGAENL